MKTKIAILLFLGFALAGWCADVKVVVNAANPITSIDKADLQKIFLGKKNTWDDGKKIASMYVKADKPEGAAFFDKVLGIGFSAFNAQWMKMLYSGNATPPQARGNSDEVVNVVSLLENSIGFVAADYNVTNPKVKVITLK
jgi:ABC-type phosphate transport system substrate-binding protein